LNITSGNLVDSIIVIHWISLSLIIVSVGGLLHIIVLVECVLHAKGSVIADDETPFEISPVF